MNRAELVKATAKLADQPTWAVDQVLSALTEAITVALSEGDEVYVRNFGRFGLQHRKASIRPHPKTREPMKVAAYYTTKFIPSTTLRKRLNK